MWSRWGTVTVLRRVRIASGGRAGRSVRHSVLKVWARFGAFGVDHESWTPNSMRRARRALHSRDRSDMVVMGVRR